MSPGMGGYSSIGGAVRKMWAEEGIRGFYKGLYPNLLKVYPSPPITISSPPSHPPLSLIPCKLFACLPRLLFLLPCPVIVVNFILPCSVFQFLSAVLITSRFAAYHRSLRVWRQVG